MIAEDLLCHFEWSTPDKTRNHDCRKLEGHKEPHACGWHGCNATHPVTQPFDPSKVDRWDDNRGNVAVRAADYDTLSLRYTNLQHFMRRMAELHGFEMEETK